MEQVARALRNLAHKSDSNCRRISTSGGLEALLNLCKVLGVGGWGQDISIGRLKALLNLWTVWGLGFRFWGLRIRISTSGGLKALLNLCKVWGLVFRVLVLGFRVQDLNVGRGLEALLSLCKVWP